MTLIRALPELERHDAPRQTVREQLQALEAVAREELAELEQLANARPLPRPARVEDLGLAWDLGLAGNAL